MSVTDELTDRDVIRRRDLPSSKVVAGLIIAGLLCVLVAKVAFDWPAFAAAIPSDVQKVAAARNGFVGRTYVYTFWGNIIDSEELWRVEVDADVLTDLVRNYQLLPLASTQEVPARSVPCGKQRSHGKTHASLQHPPNDACQPLINGQNHG